MVTYKKIVRVIVEKEYGGSFINESHNNNEILTEIHIHLTENDLKALLRNGTTRKFEFIK